MSNLATMRNATTVAQHLWRRAQGRAAVRWASLAAGVPLTGVGPVMLAMLMWFSALLWGQWWSWWWTLLATAAVLVPVLFWYAVRGSDDLLMEALQGGSPRVASGLWAISWLPGMRGVGTLAVLVAPEASVAGFQEIFLTGPRMIVRAGRKMRLVRKLRGVRLERAVEIVVCLMQRSGGVAVSEVLKSGETVESVAAELAWLVYFDWVGLSADGQKVWVLSETRTTLAV